MNILYIGPYREKTISGINSAFTLNTLLKTKHNILSRPIYSSYVPSLDFVSDSIIRSENNKMEYFDTVIQHVSIGDCVPINCASKNIAIPILDSKIIDPKIIDILHGFNSIWVDNRIDYFKLTQYPKITNKIKVYDYNLDIDRIKQGSINVGIHNPTKKIYFIGDYYYNQTNILNIIKSFIANISLSFNFTLVLFISNIDYNNKLELEKTIDQIYNSYNIRSIVKNVLIIPITLDKDIVYAAHQTGDILIDLQENASNSFNTKFASLLQKDIVQFTPEDLEFSIDYNSNVSSGGFNIIKQKSIFESIKTTLLNRKSPKITTHKKYTIDQLL